MLLYYMMLYYMLHYIIYVVHMFITIQAVVCVPS